jgi:transposase
MSSVKGKPIPPEVKQIAIKVKEYFDRNKSDLGSKDSSAQMTADALGIGLASVKRILADFNKDPELINKEPQLRGRPAHAVDAALESVVRSYIREANKQGAYITLDTIRDALVKHAPDADFHIATLARTLDRWGFTFGKGTRSQHLKEKDHVIAARRCFLRRKIANRISGKLIRPEVYLDESYVNKNHSNDLIWYSDEDGPWVQKPTGKGERLIIVNAITNEGWVPNAKLVFKATKKSGDYHGQMNWIIFRQWFSEQLMPNIPRKSLIIMDNASYHNVLATCSPPIPTSKKSEIRDWLQINKAPCSDDCLKAELVELLKKLAPEPIFALDELAREQGHEILRTPPYHPELQPIELCWGVVKNHVARNSNFTMANLLTQLEGAFERVTPTTCTKIIDKIRENEDDFWKNDAIFDKQD